MAKITPIMKIHKKEQERRLAQSFAQAAKAQMSECRGSKFDEMLKKEIRRGM